MFSKRKVFGLKDIRWSFMVLVAGALVIPNTYGNPFIYFYFYIPDKYWCAYRNINFGNARREVKQIFAVISISFSWRPDGWSIHSSAPGSFRRFGGCKCL